MRGFGQFSYFLLGPRIVDRAISHKTAQLSNPETDVREGTQDYGILELELTS